MCSGSGFCPMDARPRRTRVGSVGVGSVGVGGVGVGGAPGRREQCINTCLALSLVVGLSVFFFVPRPPASRWESQAARAERMMTEAASAQPRASGYPTTYAMASVNVDEEGVDHLPITFESLYAPDDCGDVCYRGDTVLVHYTERRGDPKSPPAASTLRDGGAPARVVLGSKGWTAGVEGMCRGMKR